MSPEVLRDTRPNGEFLRDLKRSDKDCELIGVWLLRAGVGVRKARLRIRPRYEDRLDYSDKGDLWIWVDGGWMLADVKTRKYDFDCPANFPFPTVTVEKLHNWERKKDRPQVFVLLNKERTAAIAAGACHIQERPGRDPTRDQECVFLEVPRELCLSWERFIEVLIERGEHD